MREIGRAVEREVWSSHFSVVRELGGHGMGRTIHEEPSAPNFDDPAAHQILTAGLVIMIEPIIAVGSGSVVLGSARVGVVLVRWEAESGGSHPAH